MRKLFISLFLCLGFVNTLVCQTQSDTIFNYHTETPVIIDGSANEECWANAEWHAIDQVWIPYNGSMKAGDFEGRFKVSWDSLYLYVLVEVVDDSLSDDHASPTDNWWNDDCLEVFIDENRSKGNHERNNNAFAYHVSSFYDAIDLDAYGNGINYKNNIQVVMDTIGENTYLWELAIKNYSSAFNINNPEASRVKLANGKYMGFTIAYCDNDETTARENFIGSMYMTEPTANDNYKTADYFGLMKLVDPLAAGIHEPGKIAASINIYPVPTKNLLKVNLGSHTNSDCRLKITTLTGQILKSMNVNETEFTITIDDLEAGYYFISFENADSVVSRKFIKQ